jgi:hypothetical protein
MSAPQLRAVPDGGMPESPKTVTEAADDGTQRELLVAMRARVAQAVEDPKTMARDLAALTRRLMEIAREIEAIDSRAGGDDIGDAAATPDSEFNAVTL